MAVKPGSTPITFINTVSPTVSGVLYCDDVSFTRTLQNFSRVEFDHAKLRTAPTTTGATPLIVQGFGNKPIQLLTTCTGDIPRPLTPMDSDYTSELQRFNINRYTITGAANPDTTIAALFSIWSDHAIRLNRFDMYLNVVNLEMSIDFLQNTLQPLTFSYLTSTNLTLSGPALSGSLTNMLITALDIGVEYEAPNISDSGATSTVLQSFTMTVENRTISSQGPL